MENTNFNWFEEEAVNAVIANNLSFSDEYHKEIDRQVTEEMHRILDWGVQFGHSTYKVALSLSTARKIIEEREIHILANGGINADDIDMDDVRQMADRLLSENFVGYCESDGEVYGFMKTNIVIYRAQISWINLKSMTTSESFRRPMAFAGFCE